MADHGKNKMCLLLLCYMGIMEKKKETSKGYIGNIQGLYRDNGIEHGH